MDSQSSFTVVSTFSGAGGSSLGYQLAGGKVLLAVEMDDNAVETYRLNFPDTPIYHGDISKLSAEKCMELAGVEPGELDILDGSPPCQGFSTAGKRDFGDDRNQLFREFVRLLRGLRPKVFVMENVSGMVKGKMKLIFVECLRELKASGYKVKARVLNAMYYNVPQSRQRLIFVGVREDLGIEPGHPKAQGRPISCGSVLGEEDIGLLLTGPQTDHWKGIRRGQNGSNHGNPNTWFNFHKLDPQLPAPCICKKSSGNAKHAHWKRPFDLTITGYQKLASFPLSFQFVGGYPKAKECIGNSVPPNFMKCIAEYIRDNILSAGR